jgi:hypothetical protein
MPEPSSVLSVLTSLRLGERVLVRCDDGLLELEYVLFENTDIVLRSSDPVSIREAGYMTTAREALARLAKAGATPELAEQAARALRTEVAAAHARSNAAQGVVTQLGAYELFEGGTFSSISHRYTGLWLDVGKLAGAVPVPSAASLLQALHLAAALAEVPPTMPVHMSTAGATRDRRPGERTHVRVVLDRIGEIPAALGAMTPPEEAVAIDASKERRARQALLSRVRERLTVGSPAALRAHVAMLEMSLGSHTMELGPLSDPKLQSIERQLAAGDSTGVEAQLDEIEESGGKGAGTRYLRARAALLRGEEPPRSVAQALSELAHEDRGFHEATLGAARSWLAAGEDAHARFYARQLVENPQAPESERLVALEILDETRQTARSQIPPPAAAIPGSRTQIVPNKIHLFPSLGNVPPPAPDAISNIPSLIPPALPDPSGFDPFPAERVPAPVEAPDPSPSPTRAVDVELPPHPQPAFTRPSPLPPAGGAVLRYEPELVESLPFPAGAVETSFAVNQVPRNHFEARIAMTRLSRELARDYRLWYGKSLRCNVLAVDAMQQHLAHRFAGGSIADDNVAWELRRHGALLSEIFARALGGVWTDVGPSEPGYWAMILPPSLRVLPIGRIYRFIALGHRERDLVSYYLDVESRVRSSAK